MAACKSVVVLAPNARRQTVKVNATSTVLQVLEEVCKKQSLLNDQYALQHQGKILDETLPIRYSGLSNNAHLELVPSPKTKKGSTSSTVGLQLVSGERLVKEFASSFSLWDVLSHWDSAQESPHQGKIINPSPEEEKSPVCIYMTQEISGENSLRQATLHSLGLTGKRVMIRLTYRQLTSKADSRVEAMEVSPQEKGGASNSGVSDHASVSDSRVDTPGQAVEKPSSSSPSSFSGKAKEDKGDVNKDSLEVQIEKKTSCLPHQEDVKDSKRPRFSAPKPYFANFKLLSRIKELKQKYIQCHEILIKLQFPEETAGMDIIQREKADSSRRKFLATSCKRQPLVFSESNSTSPTHRGGDLPDSFFEVTVDDLRVMLRDLKYDRIQAESAPLMTRAMREVRQESEMYKYDKVVVRVKFPDRLVLQGFFRPMEKVSALTDFVKSHLEDQNIEFYLYTTPPRRVLAEPNTTLFESKLYPASVVHFGSSKHQEHFLTRKYLESPSTVLDAEKVVIETGVLSVHSGCRRDIGDQVASESTSCSRQGSGPPSSGPHSSLQGQNDASFNRPQLGGSSKGAIPKWFKGAGK